ncbi:MAG: asparagine synthase (glutamine-hydrolyzing) [Eubacteriales bacterium]
MSSICGIFAPRCVTGEDLILLERMGKLLAHRGPDGDGSFTDEHCALHHNRLAIMDPPRGQQPMTVVFRRAAYTIVYNGEIYNTAELRAELAKAGVCLRTKCDTEVVVYAYAVWGSACVERLNGFFSFCIYDSARECLFCARDRFGVKPFFYTLQNGKFYFASEVKAFVKTGLCPARLNQRLLWELLYLAPIRLPGSGIFEDIFELKPAQAMTVDRDGIHPFTYWTLETLPNHQSRDSIVAQTAELLGDAIRLQLEADVPLCAMLSGGLDSSIVSAVAAEHYAGQGKTLATYSLEFEGSEYIPSLFQPSKDEDFAALMAGHIGAVHTVCTADTASVAACLIDAMQQRDFPGQADIDSSLYWFCRRISERHKVALSGEGADEVFGGYPWYYRPEMLSRDFFPFIHDPTARISLFRAEVVRGAEGYDYVRGLYQKAVAGVALLEQDSEATKTARVATKLTADYFMSSLLERKDRMSMACGLEVRLPFADHRLLSYVYNIPWEVKFEGQVEKALLRTAMAPYLPEPVRQRKKSPFPKTHNPSYETLAYRLLQQRLTAKHSPLAALLEPHALRSLSEGTDHTWFGQLMARAQLYAWLYQLDLWLSEYEVTLVP